MSSSFKGVLSTDDMFRIFNSLSNILARHNKTVQIQIFHCNILTPNMLDYSGEKKYVLCKTILIGFTECTFTFKL